MSLTGRRRLGELIAPSKLERAGDREFPILSMTMHEGLVDQASKFKKRVASADTAAYKVVRRDQLVVGFPIDEGVLSVQDLYDAAIVSPAYDVWDIRSDIVLPEYLERLLRSPRALSYYSQMLRGTTARRRTLPDTLFLAIDVPVPPLPQQHRVVRTLDKADAIRRKRKEAIALTDELLRSTFLEMFGDPVTNPKGWDVKPLGELLLEIQSGWSPHCLQRPAEPDEWGVLKLGALTSGKYLQSENKALGPEHEPVPGLEVKTGDVLFARKNTYEHVAACVLVASTRPKLMMSDLIFRLVLRPDVGLDSTLLWAMLGHPSKRRQVQALAGGTAGSMPNISKERLRTVQLPIPEISLQQRFRRIVAECSSLRDRADQASSVSNNLFDSLVHRAFRGELAGGNGASMPQLGFFGAGAR